MSGPAETASGAPHPGVDRASSGGDGSTAEPLRVLLVANTLPPADVSGVGEQVLQLAAGLREAGCEVEVLGRRGPGRPGAAGPKLLFPLTVVPAVAAALRRVRPDVVQVHESDGGLAALWVRLVRGRRARPLLAALLQVSYREERRAVRPLVAPGGRVLGRPGAAERRFRRLKAPLHVALGRLTARLADRVLAPSAATAAEIERDYGVRGVAVVPNATGGRAGEEAAGEGGSAGTREAVQATTEADERTADLLFVGRLRIRKGVEVLLEAWARLVESAAAPPGRVRLAIAGDGEHRAALERKAGELRIAGAVDFLGRRSAAEVRGLLAGARALVVPSVYEGMPLVVLEAMEMGVPVVASRVSGIPEVVLDGETGWLVPPEVPEALAAALREVLDEPAEARRRGAAGRRRLDARHRPAHAAAAWLAAVGAGDPRAR